VRSAAASPPCDLVVADLACRDDAYLSVSDPPAKRGRLALHDPVIEDSGNPGWSEFIIRQLMQFVTEKFIDFESRWHGLRISDELRYQQRFDAQQKGIETAALSQEKAVNAALAAAEKAVGAASTASEKAFAAALASAEKAIEKAEAAQTQHNFSQNEWRQTVNDLTKTVAETARIQSETAVNGLRSMHDAALAAMKGELGTLRSRLDKMEGNWSGITSAIAVVFGAVSLIIALSSLLLHVH
jgi:hypothetical protein